MIIKQEKFSFGRGYRYVYTIDSIAIRKDAIRFSLNAFTKLPFEEKVMRIEDGLTSYEGTLSENFRSIDDFDVFIVKYLSSPIYLIMILGRYKGHRVQVSIHLDKSIVVITGQNVSSIKEIEDILDMK